MQINGGNMKLLFKIFIMLFISISVFGQGAYLEKGKNGFGIGAGFSTNEDVAGIGGSIGYSVYDFFDFGIGVSSYSFDQQLLGSDLSTTVISTSITSYPLKQNDEIPLSFAISVGNNWQTYSNDVLDDNDIDMTGDFFSIGGSLFEYIQVSNSFRIQPSVSFSYVTGETKIKDSYGNKESEEDDTTVFGLGLGFAFNTSSNNIFVITQRVSISKGTTSFGVGFTFILGTN
jgi:hypothetical protein